MHLFYIIIAIPAYEKINFLLETPFIYMVYGDMVYIVNYE